MAPPLLKRAPGMATTSKVVSLSAVREIKKAEQEDPDYQARIAGLDKLQLLEEMVRFQEERSRSGRLSLAMMVRGKILFKALEETAETHELRLLTRSYRRHLDHEMADFLKRGARSS